MTQLEYNGYIGTADLSEADGVFHGKLAHIRDVVTYESATAEGLVKAFREAVDDYLADCNQKGREPDKPYKGQFNVRTKPDLHRAIARIAIQRGMSLNEVVTHALESVVKNEDKHAA
jgi:predicted HicB family RNase H-like nuclease